jgi:hypothetical protein
MKSMTVWNLRVEWQRRPGRIGAARHRLPCVSSASWRSTTGFCAASAHSTSILHASKVLGWPRICKLAHTFLWNTAMKG